MVANTIDALRNPGGFNLDLSLSRESHMLLNLQTAAGATNLPNNMQLNGTFVSISAKPIPSGTPAAGLVPGMATSEMFAAIPINSFDPRQVLMSLRLRF